MVCPPIFVTETAKKNDVLLFHALKRDVARHCCLASTRVMRRLIEPLITSSQAHWDNKNRMPGCHDGKKLISRKDYLTIVRYLRGE